MLDEIFICLGDNYKGNAYRKTNSPTKQYCKVKEIINFINESIINNTLRRGTKYFNDKYFKYKYKFIEGNNKRSVSMIIYSKDVISYLDEINILNQNLNCKGLVKIFNLSKIKKLLDSQIALLTFTDLIFMNKKSKKIKESKKRRNR